MSSFAIGVGGRRRRRARGRRPESADDEAGFSLLEVFCASAILILIVGSLSAMLIDSLNTALLTKQTELAASLASDMVENAKAIGETALSAVTPPTNQSCTPTYSASTYGTATVPVPIPILTASNMGQCFTVYVDSFLYAVTPTLALPTTAPVAAESIKVQVTWVNGSNTDSYFTYGIIGS